MKIYQKFLNHQKTLQSRFGLIKSRVYGYDKIRCSRHENMGIGRGAGTITAAAFLRNAIENTPGHILILQE